MKRTTKKDFKLYKKECRKWIKFFGLQNWDVDFEHTSLDGDGIGECEARRGSRHAVIRLNTEIDRQYAHQKQYKQTAFHEVCELLLMDIRILGQCRYLDESDIDCAVHGVIQRLTNSVYKGDK